MNRIKGLREEKGLSMRAVAAALKMPYTTYVNYEKGAREPSFQTMLDIADFYGVSVDYLMGGMPYKTFDEALENYLENHPEIIRGFCVEKTNIVKILKNGIIERNETINKLTSGTQGEGITMFCRLDDTDQALIRGRMEQLLESEKYKKSDAPDDIEK